MPIVAELHDGTELEFPDGTSQEVIQAKVREMSAPSFVEKMAGTTPGRFARGVASIPAGMFQLGAMGGDMLTGRKSGIPEAVASGLRNWDEAIERGRRGEGPDMARFAGEAATGGMAARGLPVGRNILSRFGHGTWQGGLFGAAMPATSENLGAEKAIQTGGGAALGGAIPILSRLLKGGYERFTAPGRRQVAGRLANDLAGPRRDAVIESLRNTDEIVPGSRPTASEAATPAGSAEFSAAGRLARQYLPSDYQDIQGAQNMARVEAVRNIGGTADDLQRATTERRQVANPLYASAREAAEETEIDPVRTVRLIENIIKKQPARTKLVNTLNSVKRTLMEEFPADQRARESIEEVNSAISRAEARTGKRPEELVSLRRILSRVRRMEDDPFDAAQEIRGLRGSSRSSREVLQNAIDTLESPNEVISSNSNRVISASKNIGDLLDEVDNTGKRVNSSIARELALIKRSLDNKIANTVPEQRVADRTYREMSRPIDRMRTGQALEDKLTSPLAEFGDDAVRQRSAAFTQALRDPSSLIRRSTAGGRRLNQLEDVLPVDDIAALNKVGQDLARAAKDRNLASAGLNRATMEAGEMFGERAPNALVRPIMILNAILTRTGIGARKKTMEEFARLMQDPQAMAKAMQAATPDERETIMRLIQIGSIGEASQMSGAGVQASSDALSSVLRGD